MDVIDAGAARVGHSQPSRLIGNVTMAHFNEVISRAYQWIRGANEEQPAEKIQMWQRLASPPQCNEALFCFGPVSFPADLNENNMVSFESLNCQI